MDFALLLPQLLKRTIRGRSECHERSGGSATVLQSRLSRNSLSFQVRISLWISVQARRLSLPEKEGEGWERVFTNNTVYQL